jgi:hypothetical protein
VLANTGRITALAIGDGNGGAINIESHSVRLTGTASIIRRVDLLTTKGRCVLWGRGGQAILWSRRLRGSSWQGGARFKRAPLGTVAVET